MVSMFYKRHQPTKIYSKKILRSIFNRCNISYTSYIDRLTKLNIKTLEYRKLELDLITNQNIS